MFTFIGEAREDEREEEQATKQYEREEEQATSEIEEEQATSEREGEESEGRERERHSDSGAFMGTSAFCSGSSCPCL
mgnify:CR=1 FL=1